MTSPIRCRINTLKFDEHYQPAKDTRLTTNFANLARGEYREQNLRNTLQMINHRFNDLAHWDNPTGERYQVELEIVSANLEIADSGDSFPAIEILKTTIFDAHTQQRIDGIVGNSFSSYIRDYDFSVWLLAHNQNQPTFSVPEQLSLIHI